MMFFCQVPKYFKIKNFVKALKRLSIVKAKQTHISRAITFSLNFALIGAEVTF
jgi:hypothetical protein